MEDLQPHLTVPTAATISPCAHSILPNIISLFLFFLIQSRFSPTPTPLLWSWSKHLISVTHFPHMQTKGCCENMGMLCLGSVFSSLFCFFKLSLYSQISEGIFILWCFSSPFCFSLLSWCTLSQQSDVYWCAGTEYSFIFCHVLDI